MIIECHVRSDLSLPSARANQIAISNFCPLFHLFCPLFHFCARYFNKNSKTTNQSDLRNNAQHVIKAMFRSTFGPVRESIRYNVNSAWGNRTGSDRSGIELFTPYGIDICFGLAKPNLPSNPGESDNDIPFQKWCRSAEQVVHIRSGAFQKAIRYGTYHFSNRSVPARNRHRNCVGLAGSNVNRRPIRYGFRDAPIIDLYSVNMA